MVEIDSLCLVHEHLENIKVVLFDLDDTLYSEKQYIRSGFKQVAKTLPFVENCEEKLWNYFVKKGKPIDNLLFDEGLLHEELKQKCLQIYRNHFPDICLYDDAAMLVNQLKNEGFMLGIITDGRVEGQTAKIDALGVRKFFDKIIITDALGGSEFRKPNPAAYELMKNFFGVQYSEMVYIGDNPRKDFSACYQLGIKPIFFVNDDGIYSK